MSGEWLAVAAFAIAGWLWWDGRQKYEQALSAARLACTQAGVQLLDETVALRSLRPARDDEQRMRLYREFSFEYSDSGDNRLPGRVHLLGNRLLGAHLLMTAAQ